MRRRAKYLLLEFDHGTLILHLGMSGSGAFLANAYSGNGGNMDLGINLVNWLGNEDKLINIQPRAAKDGVSNWFNSV